MFQLLYIGSIVFLYSLPKLYVWCKRTVLFKIKGSFRIKLATQLLKNIRVNVWKL